VTLKVNAATDGYNSIAGRRGITASDAELSIMDGVTSTTAELNILDGVTGTATEINALDADQAATTPTVTGSDSFVMDDADVGTVKVDIDNVDTYLAQTTKTLTNKTLAAPTLTSPVLNTAASGSAVLDEDDLTSDSDTQLATQQSIKAYVDSRVALGTEQATTSGTEVDFTSIPSWVKRITVNYVDVSTDGTNAPIIQIGDSGGFETTAYIGSAANVAATTAATAYNDGFVLAPSHNATDPISGSFVLTLEDSSQNTWCGFGIGGAVSGTAQVKISGGSKSLSAALTQVRFTTTGTPDDFDSGAVNIMYE